MTYFKSTIVILIWEKENVFTTFQSCYIFHCSSYGEHGKNDDTCQITKSMQEKFDFPPLQYENEPGTLPHQIVSGTHCDAQTSWDRKTISSQNLNITVLKVRIRSLMLFATIWVCKEDIQIEESLYKMNGEVPGNNERKGMINHLVSTKRKARLGILKGVLHFD